jgi:DMSO/TMAO reductase YedYZ heme-binding membrane subunit
MGLPRLIHFDEHRHRRMAELIGVLWVLSLADLFFTLWAHFFTPFNELNPVANFMLSRGLVPSLILFKLVVTAIGTRIFWRLRHHGRAELALWALVGVYVLLTVHWGEYTTNALAMV